MAQPPPSDGPWPWQQLPEDGDGNIDPDSAAAVLGGDAPVASRNALAPACGAADPAGAPASLRLRKQVASRQARTTTAASARAVVPALPLPPPPPAGRACIPCRSAPITSELQPLSGLRTPTTSDGAAHT